MGIPVLQGRAFTGSDRTGAPPVAILSATAAADLFAGESPIGRYVTIGRPGGKNPRIEVVGVVADVRLRGPDATEQRIKQVYVSLLQSPPFGNVSLVVEADGDPAAIAGAIRAAIRDVDAAVPIYDLHTIDAVVDRFLASHRLALSLVGGFAIVTVVVAAIGLYGLTAQLVAQRSREIGLRIALGADPGRVWRGIVAQGLSLAAAGSIAGAIAAYFGLQLFAAYMPGISGVAPGVVAGNALLLAVVATIATWVPASRAARINPVEAIRADG
jgi:ABC-type antimicrobial peptide transport system permease subunit